MREAGKAGNLDYIRDELIPLLTKSGRRNDAAGMESYLKLLSVEPDKFLETAAAFSKTRARFNPMGDESRRIFEVWKDRELDVDISSIMSSQITQQLRTNNYYRPTGVLQEYVTELLKRNGTIKPFMKQISEAFLGPKAGQAAFIAKHYDQNQRSSNTPNARIHAYRNLLQQMAQKPEVVLPVTLEAAELGLIGDMGFGSRLGQAIFNSEDPAEAKTLLSKSAFVKDVAEFRAYASSKRPQTIWDQALGYARNDQEKTKQLLEGAPKTFGWDLIRATGGGNYVRAEIVKLMKEYREKINALPENRKREISIMAKNMLNRFGGSSNAEYEEVVVWLKSLDVAKEETGYFEKVLKARNTQQLAKDLGSANRFQKQLTTLAGSDRKKAKEVFSHVVKVAERSAGGGGSPFGGGYGGGGPNLFNFYDQSKSFSSHLVEVLMGEHSGGEIDLKGLGFVLDLIATADPEIPPGNNFSYRMNNLFQRNRRGGKPLDAVKKVYKDLGTAVGDAPVAILSQSFGQMMQNYQVKDLEKIVEWSKEESESGEHQNVAKELLAAAKLAAAKKAPRKKSAVTQNGEADPHFPSAGPSQLPLEAYEHYLTTLNDEALPVTTREHICNWLLNTPNPRKEFIYVGADLLATDKKDLAHSREFLQNVLRRFSSVDRNSDEWKTAATKLTGYWNKTLLRRQTAQSRQSGYLRQETIILPLMAMNSELGQSKEFMKLFRMYGQNFSHSTALMAMMVRYDQLDEARGLFNMRLQSGNQLHGYSNGGIAYSEELEQRVPAFLEKLKHNDERYAAELLLVSLPDNLQNRNRRPQDSKKDSPRNQRLKELSQKFGSIEFGTEQMKEAVLALLLTHYPDSMLGDTSPIRDEVTKLIQSYDMADSMDYRSGLMNVRQPLYRGYVRAGLQRGDASTIAKLIDDIAEVEVEERDHGMRQLLESVLTPLTQSMQKSELLSWEKKDLATVATAIRKMSDPKREQLHRYVRNLMTNSVAIHVLAGEHEAFEKLFAETKKASSQSTSRRSSHTRFYSHDLINMFGNHQSSKDAVKSISKERRIEIVGSLIRCLDALDQLQLEQRGTQSYLNLQNHGNLQQALERTKLLERNEIAENAAELSKVDGGYVWAMVAMDLEKKSQQNRGRSNGHGDAKSDDDETDPTEKAIEAWQKAIAAAKNSETQTRFRLGLANLYKRLKRNDEAKKVISEQKEVPPRVKPHVDRLLKSLSWVIRFLRTLAS